MTDAGADPELLETAVTRRSALVALADGPHHRNELEHELGVSKTTCHRIVREFDDRGLLRRTDRGYELSPYGRLVERAVDRYVETVRTAGDLRPLVRAVESTPFSLDVSAFTAATITSPEPGDPYPFVERFMELFRASDTIRVLDRNQFVPPLYVEEALETAIESGMHGEFVVPKSIAYENVTTLSELQQRVADGAASGKWLIYEDPPFGVALYDDHVDVRVYDPDSDAPLLLVDTDDPDAIAWGETVYSHYREQATPASSFEEFPGWMPDTDLPDGR